MASKWIVLAILSWFGNVVCPPGPGDHDIVCSHCGGSGRQFPVCLFDQHRCHHDEYCFMTDKHGDLRMSCWTHKDCEYILDKPFCHLGEAISRERTCAVCCKTELCVRQQIASFKKLTATTTHKPTTASHHTTDSVTPTSGKIYDRLIAGYCHDTLLLNGCQSSKYIVCQDSVGVALCPETCGLCSSLSATFHGSTQCVDQTKNDGCIKTNSSNPCRGQQAMTSCPKTCGLCETVLQQEISKVIALNGPHTDEVSVMQSVTTPAPTTSMSTKSIPPTSSTTSTPIMTTPLTTEAGCSDFASDCSILGDVCQSSLGGQICQKSCNICV